MFVRAFYFGRTCIIRSHTTVNPVNPDVLREWCNILCSCVHSMLVHALFVRTPLTEEIRLEMFGSPDYPVFPGVLSSDRDSVKSHKNSFENMGTSVKTCLKVTGTLRETCLKFRQS